LPKNPDEPVREELKTKAERLNPDAWVTDDEVAAALEQYETYSKSFAVVGRPPPRCRGRYNWPCSARSWLRELSSWPG
jgi:hypothetical protein